MSEIRWTDDARAYFVDKRILSNLANNNIKTVNDLLRQSPMQILGWKHIGMARFRTVMRFINEAVEGKSPKAQDSPWSELP